MFPAGQIRRFKQTMAKTKIKPIVTYRMRAESETATRTALWTRDLFDISDEPTDRGGSNEGFAPTEFVLAGLMACSNVIANKIARDNGFEIDKLEIETEAHFNRLGVNLLDEVAVVFPEIKLTLHLYTSAPDDKIDILKRDLKKYCAVSKLIRQSGSKVIEDWIIQRH
jgi:uncharacterized OsmC-like protein